MSAAVRAAASGVELERAVTVDAVRAQLRALGHDDAAVPDDIISSFLKDIFAEVKAEAASVAGAKMDADDGEAPVPAPVAAAPRTGSLPAHRGGRLVATPPPAPQDGSASEGEGAVVSQARPRLGGPARIPAESAQTSADGSWDTASAGSAAEEDLDVRDALGRLTLGAERPYSAFDVWQPDGQEAEAECASASAAFGRLLIPAADEEEVPLEDQPLSILASSPSMGGPPSPALDTEWTPAPDERSAADSSSAWSAEELEKMKRRAKRFGIPFVPPGQRTRRLGVPRRVQTPQSGAPPASPQRASPPSQMHALRVPYPDSPAPPATAPERPPGFTPASAKASSKAPHASPYRSPYAARPPSAGEKCTPRRPMSARATCDAGVQMPSPSLALGALVASDGDAAPSSPPRPQTARPSGRAKVDRVSAYASHNKEWSSRRTTLGSVGNKAPRRRQNFFKMFAEAHAAEAKKDRLRRRAVRDATAASLADRRPTFSRR